jgi:hypothetical protein
MTTQFNKVKIEIGYKTYIVDANQGVQLMQILNNAEIFEEKTKRCEDASYTSSFYCYEQDTKDMMRVNISLIPSSLYRMAKLAGKPPKGD